MHQFSLPKKGLSLKLSNCWPGDVSKATTFAHQSGFHQLPLAASLGGAGTNLWSPQWLWLPTDTWIPRRIQMWGLLVYWRIWECFWVSLGRLQCSSCCIVFACPMARLCIEEDYFVTLWVALRFPWAKPTWVVSKKPDGLFSIAQGGQSISGDCSVCPHQTLFGKGSSAYLLLASWNGWCWFRAKGSFDLFCRMWSFIKSFLSLVTFVFFLPLSLSFFSRSSSQVSPKQ